jgi:hypothetical protein
MAHLTDDQLILHFYGEDTIEAEAEVDAHLSTCATCQSTWNELRETLKMMDAASVPEPPSGFERVMWARIEPALPPRRRPSSIWRFAWMPIAAAAGVVLALGYGWVKTHQLAVGSSTPSPVPTTVASRTSKPLDPAKARERVLLTALDDHFQQMQVLLVELMNQPDNVRGELAFERASADDLVASGRVYRVTAEQNGDMQLAHMLEDVESVLVEVARSPEKVNAADLKSIRSRIEGQSLLFKVRAVSNEIHNRQRDLLIADE